MPLRLMVHEIALFERAVAFARPEEETPNMDDDRQWREMTADPKFRRVLVTNGRSAIGLKNISRSR